MDKHLINKFLKAILQNKSKIIKNREITPYFVTLTDDFIVSLR